MPTGKIKWFDNAKGWGFITPSTGESDIFIHYSSIVSQDYKQGYKLLYPEQSVEYSLEKRDRGVYAIALVPGPLPLQIQAAMRKKRKLKSIMNITQKTHETSDPST